MRRNLCLSMLLGLSQAVASPALPLAPVPSPRGILEGCWNLPLGEAQRQAIQAIEGRHRPRFKAFLKDLTEKETTLIGALGEPDTADSQLLLLHEAVSEARLQLLLEQRATMLEILAVLAPAQLAHDRERFAGLLEGLAVSRGLRMGSLEGATSFLPL